MDIEKLKRLFPILKEPELDGVALSIERLLGDDALDKDRGMLVETFDANADEESDFFFNMLCMVNFINDPNATAYTDPKGFIFLNYPNTQICPQDNNRFARWYFIYCHECLHQLWDTFGVAEKIKQKYGNYNHTLLNIASDVVINDFLANIKNKNKIVPNGIWLPETLKDKYGIEYNNRVDTQFTLYEKMLNMVKTNQDKMVKDYQEFEGKFKPKKIENVDGQGGGGEPQTPHSADYKKGWNDGIRDCLSKKINPKKWLEDNKSNTPKNDYEQGYHDVVEQINTGLEDGLTMSKGGGNGNSSDLADIPWEQPNQNQSGGNDGDNNDNQNQNNGQNQSGQKSSKEIADSLDKLKDKVEKSNDVSQQSKDKLKDVANKAKAEASKNPNGQISDDLKNEINDAISSIKSDINKSKDGKPGDQQSGEQSKNGKSGEQSGDQSKDGNSQDGNQGNNNSEISKAIEDFENELNGNGQQGNDGESNGNGQQGNDGESNSNQNSSSPQNGKSSSGDSKHLSNQRIKELEDHAKKTIAKEAENVNGILKDFLGKCNRSAKLQKPDINDDLIKQISGKGNTSWAKELETISSNFVRNKLRNNKEYKDSYARPVRGAKPISRAQLRNGGAVINPGRQEVRNKIGFDLTVFFDTSGSMSGDRMTNATKTMWPMLEHLRKEFGKEPNVDRDKITLKAYEFKHHMSKIAWGQPLNANGGTYDLDELLTDIQKEGANSFLNIVITDGDFNCDKNKDLCARVLDEMDGLFIIITCQSKGYFDGVEKYVNNKLKDEKGKPGGAIKVIYTDNTFSTNNIF